jgi:hypothetical protein
MQSVAGNVVVGLSDRDVGYHYLDRHGMKGAFRDPSQGIG